MFNGRRQRLQSVCGQFCRFPRIRAHREEPRAWDSRTGHRFSRMWRTGTDLRGIRQRRDRIDPGVNAPHSAENNQRKSVQSVIIRVPFESLGEQLDRGSRDVCKRQPHHPVLFSQEPSEKGVSERRWLQISPCRPLASSRESPAQDQSRGRPESTPKDSTAPRPGPDPVAAACSPEMSPHRENSPPGPAGLPFL